MIALLFLACQGTPQKVEAVQDTAFSDSDNQSDDDTTTTPIDTATAAELVGTIPDVALPVADFAATNSDGQARTSINLTGQPTVIWFYPAAGTYG